MEHKLATVLEEFGVPERKLRADVAGLGLEWDKRLHGLPDKIYRALKAKYSAPATASTVTVIKSKKAAPKSSGATPKVSAPKSTKKAPVKVVEKEAEPEPVRAQPRIIARKVEPTPVPEVVAVPAPQVSEPVVVPEPVKPVQLQEIVIIKPQEPEQPKKTFVADRTHTPVAPRQETKIELHRAPIKFDTPRPSTPKSATPKVEAPKLQPKKKHKHEKKNRRREESVVEPVVPTEPAGPVDPSTLPEIAIPASITVKDFAAMLKVGVNQIISELFKNGIIANINQRLDFDVAEILAQEFGFRAVVQVANHDAAESVQLSTLLEDDEKNLITRSPVISVMGHVDHGKTKLLDTLRGTTVMEGEAGGITQKIGAYQILRKARDGTIKAITFLDTPGHQAFTAMRARGAQVTDIAILVVAADDGVKPQTVEAYEHAKAAGVPVVVAITKIDKEGANPDRVKAELAEIGLVVEDWGGATVCAEVSATQKKGIDELLELVLLVSDMQDLKANANRTAVGTIIESRLDQSHGALATVLVHTGTLHIRDDVVIGDVFGKIRSMVNDRGERITDAGPSCPVQITGMSKVPQVGDILRVVANKRDARSQVHTSSRDKQPDLISGISSHSQNKEGVKEMKVVIKADTKGSLEALRNALLSLPSEKIAVKIIYAGLGNISNSDVMIASAGKGTVFGFNVLTPVAVQKSADIERIKITTFDVIYHLLDEVQKVLLTMLEPEVRITVVGKLRILKVFFDGKGEQVAGGDVIQGKIVRGSFAKVYRGENIVGEMVLETVKEGPEDVKEVQQGIQCGVKLIGNIRILPEDIVECYVKETIAVSL
jgi:translation initiation factor IF-2